MISNLLAIIYGLTIAVGVLLVIKFNQNKLTIRGKRVVFVCSILAGFLLAQIILHVEVNCDLRIGSTTPCAVRWF
jgi:hypothetical protein